MSRTHTFPDGSSVMLHKDQKWLPVIVTDLTGHPFSVGQILKVSGKVKRKYTRQVGCNVAIVSGIRKVQLHKNQMPAFEVELLGRPLKWFSADWFEA